MRNIIFIFLAVIVLIMGCTFFQSKEIKQLQATEVRGYDGENLSSVGDFRENSIKGPQKVDISSYNLKITGFVKEPQNLTYNQVISLQKYSKVVTLYCVEGWDAKILWEGILLKDLFEKAGVKPEANTVIFHAHDGYTSSLPLDYVLKNNIMIAYKMNNVTLPSERGFPFQVIAEDKWGYKWVKWLTEIELSNDTNYKGTWEKQGYSVEGNLNSSFFD